MEFSLTTPAPDIVNTNNLDQFILADKTKNTYYPTEWEKQTEKFKAEVFGEAPAVIARFYIGCQKLAMKSEELGYPYYQDCVCVYLQVSGEKDSVTHIVVDDEYKIRFAKEWELFQRNYQRRTIPLTSLPQMMPSTLETLKDMGINNVDDVIAANLPEPLQKYKKWALWIKSVHEVADGKAKLKVVA